MIRGDVQTAALPSTASPKTWRRLLELLCDPQLSPAQRRVEVAWLRRELRQWPAEVSRPAPTAKIVERRYCGGRSATAAQLAAFFIAHDDVKPLCRIVHETDLYPLYIEKVCTSPLLRLHDGTQAVHLARAFTGKLAERRIGQAGQGDLAGGLCVEWWARPRGCRWAGGPGLPAADASHGDPERHVLDVRLEVEVKMDDGELEDSQVARQTFFARRGGVYVVPTRCAEAIELILLERARILREVTA